MARWIKFTDYMPTEADAGPEGEVFVRHSGGEMGTADIYWAKDNPDHYEGCFWLENVPPLPTPRTLEDVVREYLASADWSDPWSVSCWRNEMREILEKGKDNG